MTPRERGIYFSELWPAACLANEWDVKDEAKRRAITAECMRAIGAMVTESTSKLGRDEVTALFTFLRHLADPASFDKSAQWDRCKQDYRTFNRAQQADWHERELYGAKPNRLARDRFAGEASAAGGVLDDLDPVKVAQRHMTVAHRHQKKLRRERLAATPAPQSQVPPARTQRDLAGTTTPFPF